MTEGDSGRKGADNKLSTSDRIIFKGYTAVIGMNNLMSDRQPQVAALVFVGKEFCNVLAVSQFCDILFFRLVVRCGNKIIYDQVWIVHLVNDDGVVITSIYCVVCPVATRWHTSCIVKTRLRTLLLGVSATLRLPVYLYFYLAIFKHCLDFLRVHQRCGPVICVCLTGYWLTFDQKLGQDATCRRIGNLLAIYRPGKNGSLYFLRFQ